jgi:hypothetical protein
MPLGVALSFGRVNRGRRESSADTMSGSHQCSSELRRAIVATTAVVLTVDAVVVHVRE